jgi:quercetin dioxygenase-like cupin family protein
MRFVDGNDPTPRMLIGPADGARTLFRERARWAAGFFVGLHTHQGDESFEVREGRVRFAAGDERRTCEPGTLVFVPAGVEHGLLLETDAVIDIFSQQDMGLYVVVCEPDGSRRTEEVFMEGFPSTHAPPAGQGWTPAAQIRALYETTRHLL